MMRHLKKYKDFIFLPVDVEKDVIDLGIKDLKLTDTHLAFVRILPNSVI